MDIEKYRIKDRAWIKSALLVRRDIEAVREKANGMDPGTFTTADLKFTNTMLGANFCINPLPQFTHSADIKRRGRGMLKGMGNEHMGMGRYYSETYDDHYQIVHMRFGVASFNDIATFVNSFYTPAVATVARTGRGPGLLFRVGQVAGFVISVITWKLLAVRALYDGLSVLAGKSLSRFVTLKPSMPVYWNAVQTIVNQLAVNIGVVPRAIGIVEPAVDAKYDFNQNDIYRIRDAFPDGEHFFTPSGSVDVYAMANRAQRMARQQMRAEEALFNNEFGSDPESISRIFSELANPNSLVEDNGPKVSYENYIKKWFESGFGRTGSSETSTVTVTDKISEDTSVSSNIYVDDSELIVEKAANNNEAVQKILKDKKDESGSYLKNPTIWESIKSSISNIFTGSWKFFEAEFDDGSAFANFRVHYTGSVSESWSNTTGESEIASKLNSYSAQGRNLKFSTMGGNLFPGADGLIQAAKDITNGVASMVGLGSLGSGAVAAYTGGANLDIPLMWKDSNVSLPKASYTIHLVLPYNNPVMQLMYIYVPLAMLLAGVMPLSTGRNSYTSPLLLEFYDKGRMQSRYAIIDSMTVTRGGATNLGFNWDHRAMSYEISFTIQDLSPIMHMPISMGGGIFSILDGDWRSGFFDDDTIYNDYLSVLSSLGVADQIYYWRKKKLQLTKMLLKWEDFTNPRRWMNLMGDTVAGRFASMFYSGIPF